jgi:hypothetical protein
MMFYQFKHLSTVIGANFEFYVGVYHSNSYAMNTILGENSEETSLNIMNNANVSFLRGYSKLFKAYCQWGIDLV